MPLFLCTTCDREFEARAAAWGATAACPNCKTNAKTIAWSVDKRTAKANGIANSKHPVFGNGQLLLQTLSFLDEKGLTLAMLVCSRWGLAAQRLFTSYVPRMIAYGSMSHTLKDVLIAPDTGLLTNVRNLQLAVDQFPFPGGKYKGSLLDFIVTKKIKIDLSLGTDDERTRQALIKAAQSVTVIKGFAKMHNKLWVLDEDGIILGSPNVSFSGLEGRNIESFIHIRSVRLGRMFTKYLKLLKTPIKTLVYNQLNMEMLDELTLYNRESHRLKVAMAPVINITDFVAQELEGAVKIVVRQFLVSHKHEHDRSDGLDIVDVLCGMAGRGVDIEIVLDQSAYDDQDFVRRAVWDLGQAGCKVYLQQPVLVVDTGSECLMHDKLILATLHKGVKRTLIGSAGFTSKVIANKNAECFISTDLESVFDSMLLHSDTAHKTQTTTQLVFKK
jgi:hypothetical protein